MGNHLSDKIGRAPRRTWHHISTLMEYVRVASYIGGQVHHEMHPCGVQSRTLRSAEQLARRRLLFLSEVHGPLERMMVLYFQIIRSLPGLLPPQFVHICLRLKLLCNNFTGVLRILLNVCFLQSLCALG